VPPSGERVAVKLPPTDGTEKESDVAEAMTWLQGMPSEC